MKMFGKIAWAVFMTYSLASELGWDRLAQNFAVFSKITWIIVLQNCAVLGLIGLACFALHRGPLKFSWLNLFGTKATNINVAPMEIPWFGLLFIVLLAISLPSLALGEEKMFRLGIVTWPAAFKWSVIFGLAHCIVGVPLSAGLAISIGGLWFHYNAFEGGITQSTIHHTTYNLIVCTMMFLAALASHFVPAPQPLYIHKRPE